MFFFSFWLEGRNETNEFESEFRKKETYQQFIILSNKVDIFKEDTCSRTGHVDIWSGRTQSSNSQPRVTSVRSSIPPSILPSFFLPLVLPCLCPSISLSILSVRPSFCPSAFLLLSIRPSEKLMWTVRKQLSFACFLEDRKTRW